jgi:hypothetical protein
MMLRIPEAGASGLYDIGHVAGYSTHLGRDQDAI